MHPLLLHHAASKEGRLEELVQQHHADRVKMHELHEKCSTTETEMVCVLLLY